MRGASPLLLLLLSGMGMGMAMKGREDSWEGPRTYVVVVPRRDGTGHSHIGDVLPTRRDCSLFPGWVLLRSALPPRARVRYFIRCRPGIPVVVGVTLHCVVCPLNARQRSEPSLPYCPRVGKVSSLMRNGAGGEGLVTGMRRLVYDRLSTIVRKTRRRLLKYYFLVFTAVWVPSLPVRGCHSLLLLR